MSAATSATVQLALELVRRRSITPEDDGCQKIISERLQTCGFTIEDMHFGAVNNLWARRGDKPPMLVFAGHTDVVPAGPLADWKSDPFKPEIRDGKLYGRGTADMKGSLAAMVVAVEAFIRALPQHNGSIAFLLTSDEEGIAVDGTRKVVETLQSRGDKIDYCLVGEPSSQKILGDTLKNGRRGSLAGHLVVRGVQGHVAYPQLADNPIHRLVPALAELCAIEWDKGNQDFPPTSFQVSNLNAGTGADNVIPGSAELLFNLRYSTELDVKTIQQRIHATLDKHGLDYHLDWRHSGAPFLTASGELVDAAIAAVKETTGTKAELSTAGGTSDGRFIAPTGAQVVELGPVNSSIHQVNEHVLVDDLDRLTHIYKAILQRLLG